MRQFGLIGFPLSHSFSAKYFAKKFTDEQIMDARYQLFPLKEVDKFQSLLEQHPDLSGLNVTIPHKISILPFLHSLSEEAASAGAVNCIKIDRNSSGVVLSGYNTDVYGFKESLLPLLNHNHRNALVLGSGGAAKAVCYTLKKLGLKCTLVSRAGDGLIALNYSQLSEEIISNNMLIINATPLGTYPDVNDCPAIPYQFLGNNHILFDLVYNPAETKFLCYGREAGAATLNGLKMLELQAEKSWEIWNG